MIRDLTIEYRKNPIGIDEKPRFSWKLESEKQDVVQTNYQVLCLQLYIQACSCF